MTETDIRERAAAELEAAANAAQPELGRWRVGGDGIPDVRIVADDPDADVARVDDCDDAAYIAMLDPTVGRALAAWLRDNAERHAFDPDAYHVDEASGTWTNVCTCEEGGPFPCPDAEHAIAVARAVLREAA
jgi:hypothetical protein